MIKLAALIVSLALSVSSFGSTWFVTPTAQGLKNGTSWTNSWTASSIAWGSVKAGDTVFLAGGSYSSFVNIPSGTAGTKDLPISIRRVVASDLLGGSTVDGWQASYDSNVVTSATIELPATLSYVTFDGRTKGGITLNTGAAGGSSVHASGTVALTGLAFKWMQLNGNYKTSGVSTGDYGFNIAPQNGSVTNLLISHCRVLGKCEALRENLWNTAVIEYSYFGDEKNDNVDHADIIYEYPSKNVTWRYNQFNNSPDDGIFHEFGGAVNETWIGNVFYNSLLHQIFFKGPGTYGPIFLYNNTFYGTTTGGSAMFIGDGGSKAVYAAGSKVSNNIFFNTLNSLSGVSGVTSTNNAYSPATINGWGWPSGESGSFTFTGSGTSTFVTVPADKEGDGVVGNEGSNFSLQPAVAAKFQTGVALASDGYQNVDPNGVARGSGGWTIGAYQFGGAQATPTPVPTPTPTPVPTPTPTPVPTPTPTPSPSPSPTPDPTPAPVTFNTWQATLDAWLQANPPTPDK